MHNEHAARAKLFQSFDSLKGFKDYLKVKERVLVERKVLSEDDYIELDKTIRQVSVGMMIRVVYYDHGEYVQKEGLVAKLDLEIKRMIQIVNQKIALDAIIEIELL